MSQDSLIVAEIDRLYQWIDETLASHSAEAGQCTACGKCCDFEAYGHRLYVTHAEMLYFSEKIGVENLKPMPLGSCPYRVDNRCSVHDYRFSGCRIYGCQGDSEFQNQLTEQALDKIKAGCNRLGIPYEYLDLREALNRSAHL